MAELALNLLKHSLHGPVTNAAVVMIRQIADAAGQFPEHPFESAVPIPAGPTKPVIIKVPEGRFTLTARMPSGATDRRTVRAAEGQLQTITFDTGHSQQEWLSWQTLSGSIPPRDSHPRPAMRDKRSRSLAPRQRSGATNRFAASMLSASSSMIAAPARNSSVQLAAGRLTFEGARFLPAPSGLKLRLSGSNPDADVWEVQGGQSLYGNLRSENGGRPLAIIRSREAYAIAALPLPWRYMPLGSPGSGHQAAGSPGGFVPVDLLIDGQAEPKRAMRMTLREPEFVALLSYMAAGRLSEAAAALGGPSLDAHVTRLIREKISNPLSAAGAAYVGLATSGDDAVRKLWGPWFANLMRWFPGLPDGAVLYARYCIDRGRNSGDLIEGKKALKTAFQRGVPLYAVGLQHLLNGLQLFSDPDDTGLFDPEAKKMRDNVAEVAALVDATQPFTVLTIPWPT